MAVWIAANVEMSLSRNISILECVPTSASVPPFGPTMLDSRNPQRALRRRSGGARTPQRRKSTSGICRPKTLNGWRSFGLSEHYKPTRIYANASGNVTGCSDGRNTVENSIARRSPNTNAPIKDGRLRRTQRHDADRRNCQGALPPLSGQRNLRSTADSVRSVDRRSVSSKTISFRSLEADSTR